MAADETGNRSGGPSPPDKRRMDMPTFGPLWRVRLQVPHIGGHQLVREVTISQLLAGFLALVVVGWLSGFVLSGAMRLLPALVAGGGAAMLVGKVDSGGRSVWRELYRMAAYPFTCRLYHGVAPVGAGGTKKRKKHLLALIAAEQRQVTRDPSVPEIVYAGLRQICRELWETYGPRPRPRPRTRTRARTRARR